MRRNLVWGLIAALVLLAAPSGFPEPGAGEMAQNSGKAGKMSDRERAGLRGPVRSCTEHKEWPNVPPDKQMSTTTEYDRAGRILSRTTGSEGSRWSTSYSYSREGQLLKTVTSSSGRVVAETNYAYDASGRMVSMTSRGEHENTAIVYQYDAKGRKTSLEAAPPKRSNVAYGGSSDGSDVGFQVKAKALCGSMDACARLKTNYDDRDVPQEIELLDAGGRVLARLVRDFDPNGNVVGERTAEQSPEEMLPAEMRQKIQQEIQDDHASPEQFKAFAKLLGAMTKSTSHFEYDKENRLTRAVVTNGVLGEQVTSISYNEHGDKSAEQVRRNGGAGFSGTITRQGAILPNATPSLGRPPRQEDTRYVYQYDEHGNWVERVREFRSKPEDDFQPAGTDRRTLTYY